MLSNITSLATLLVASHAMRITSQAEYEYENNDGEMIAKESMSAADVGRCMMSLCEEFPEKLWNTMDTN